MVCDWRVLNKITAKVQARLPNIEDFFDTVRGAKCFSKLELRSGYHQVRIKNEDVRKTALKAQFGHFQFRVMGSGLTNAPATFMLLMNIISSPFLRVCVVVFLDGIMIFSHSWSEHLVHLDQAFTALAKEELFCKLEKCDREFESALIKILRHLLTGRKFNCIPRNCRRYISRLARKQ